MPAAAIAFRTIHRLAIFVEHPVGQFVGLFRPRLAVRNRLRRSATVNTSLGFDARGPPGGKVVGPNLVEFERLPPTVARHAGEFAVDGAAPLSRGRWGLFGSAAFE